MLSIFYGADVLDSGLHYSLISKQISIFHQSSQVFVVSHFKRFIHRNCLFLVCGKFVLGGKMLYNRIWINKLQLLLLRLVLFNFKCRNHIFNNCIKFRVHSKNFTYFLHSHFHILCIFIICILYTCIFVFSVVEAVSVLVHRVFL